ncbi:MAG: hypothetical protein ACAI35_06605 [Candidatus Methylacidiphilales bacterium]|nr:hypothetical protein [Candidatus Methylacidiphilales bacterium]
MPPYTSPRPITKALQWIPATGLEMALPFVVRWARRRERDILQHGSALTQRQMEDAANIGVAHPDRIRILTVNAVPFPMNPVLRLAGHAFGLHPAATLGMSLGYGIYIRRDYQTSRRVIVHEMVHTAQHERLGGIDRFIKAYFRECYQFGYLNAPLEREAMLAEQHVW